MENTTDRKRRSEALTKDELKAFVKLYGTDLTKTDAELDFKVSRQVLDLVAIKGHGSPETIEKIRQKITQAA
jgi:hypothetical protein